MHTFQKFGEDPVIPPSPEFSISVSSMGPYTYLPKTCHRQSREIAHLPACSHVLSMLVHCTHSFRLSSIEHITYIQMYIQFSSVPVRLFVQALKPETEFGGGCPPPKQGRSSLDESLQPVSELCYDFYYTSFPLHL